MNNRIFLLGGIFISIYITYQVLTTESEVEQQPVTAAHIKEAIDLARPVMSAVDDYFDDSRSLPISNKDVGIPFPNKITSANVKSITVSGRVIVQFKKHLQQGVRFELRPEFTKTSPIKLEWRCAVGNLDKRMFEQVMPSCMYTDSDVMEDLLKGIRSKNLEMITEAIDNGADVNQQAMYGTPLFHAISRGKVEIVEVLLENGADIELVSAGTDRTPLMYALKNGSSEVVRYLVQRGANVNARNKKGKHVLSFAGFDMRDFLIEEGADPENY